jgi:hypothetical protein
MKYYFKNAAGDRAWETLGNWFTDVAGTVPASSVPWLSQATAGADVSLVTGEMSSPIIGVTTYGGGVRNMGWSGTYSPWSITGTCDIPGVEFRAVGVVGGTWTGNGLVFTHGNGAVIYSGTFTGDNLSNAAEIWGGEFRGAGFVNQAGGHITSGTFYSMLNHGSIEAQLHATITFHFPCPRPIPGDGTCVAVDWFHDGSGGVLAFVGPYPPDNPSYFSPAADTNWDTLRNWFADADFTLPALTLPQAGTAVHICGEMQSGPSVPVVLSHIYASPQAEASMNFTGARGDATVTGPQDPQDGYARVTGTIDGNAVFDGAAQLTGTVTSNARFSGHAENASGWVNYGNGVLGNAVFDYARAGVCTLTGQMSFAVAAGTMTGVDGEPIFSLIFNDDSSFHYGTFSGSAIFNDRSICGGSIAGDVTFNADSLLTGGGGQITGNPTFNDRACNWGFVAGNGTFNGQSTNQGIITGDATVNFPHKHYVEGMVFGAISYEGFQPNIQRQHRRDTQRRSLAPHDDPVWIGPGLFGDRLELWYTATEGDADLAFDPSIVIPADFSLPTLPEGQTYILELAHNGVAWVLVTVGGYGMKL